MNRNAQVRVGSIAALAIAFAIPACSSTSTPNGEPPLPTLPAPSTTSALPVSPATPSLDPRAVRIGEGQWAGKTAAERKKSCLRYTTYPGAYRRGFLGPPNDPINPPAGITPQEAWDSWEYILLRECPGATPTANASRQPGQVNEEFLEAFRRIDDQSTIDVTVDQFCGWWTDPSSNETDEPCPQPDELRWRSGVASNEGRLGALRSVKSL